MAIVALPVFILLFVLALRNPNGVGIPGGFSTINLFDFFFNSAQRSPTDILYENYTLWLVLYSVAQVLFYTDPLKRLFKYAKFNPHYPSLSLICAEFLRSARGVLICSCYEILFYMFISRPGYEPWRIDHIIPSTITRGDVNSVKLIMSALLVYLWSDAHFYWTHRILHTPWLYKNVHKYHHESFNPDPFSGLSMHPLESAVYFSAALLLGLCGCPAWLVRLVFKGLIIFPLEGHSGYGSWHVESSNNHYIHHSKFNWNYGSSPMWDHLCGTAYPTGRAGPHAAQRHEQSMSKREKEALVQASMVGCDIADLRDGISKRE